MAVVSIKAALSGTHPVGSEVTVRGWVRTRRDSKAGLSFVNLSDGSCFDPIQIVAPPGTVVNVQYPGASVGGNTETHPKLADMDLVRLSRLSVGRVTPDEWKHVLKKSEKPQS